MMVQIQKLIAWTSNYPLTALISMVAGWLAVVALLVWAIRIVVLKKGKLGTFLSHKKLRELTRDLRIVGRRSGRALSKSTRWLNSHLVQVVAWLAILILVPVFFIAQRTSDDPLGEPENQLIFLGLLILLCVFVQFGQDLLPRLKKVGPVEFAEQQYTPIVKYLEKFGSEYTIEFGEKPPPLSRELRYEYEKADQFLSHLEWTINLGREKVQDSVLHRLLLKVSAIALMQHEWVRAADRLELLLKISGGAFKPGEVRYRLGVACSRWAQSLRQGGRSERERREELFEQALEHFHKAVKENPHNRWAFFNMAYVQFDLKMYEKARQNYKEAISIRKDFARAKYDLTTCYIKLDKLDEALTTLKSIGKGDEDAAIVIEFARARDEEGRVLDQDLAPLLENSKFSSEAQQFLDSFTP